MNAYRTSGGGRLLFFYEKLRPADFRAVSRQMRKHKFDPSLILGTASRCRFGFPRVIVCFPLQFLVQSLVQSLAPFPTTFWLTCPWLAHRAGALESDGGVGELERWIGRRAREWLHFNMEHQRIRLRLLPPLLLDFLRRRKPEVFDRLRGTGVGGIQYGAPQARVKCLHLQTASWLALRRHPGADWLEAHGARGDCGGEMSCFCGDTGIAENIMD